MCFLDAKPARAGWKFCYTKLYTFFPGAFRFALEYKALQDELCADQFSTISFERKSSLSAHTLLSIRVMREGVTLRRALEGEKQKSWKSIKTSQRAVEGEERRGKIWM